MGMETRARTLPRKQRGHKLGQAIRSPGWGRTPRRRVAGARSEGSEHANAAEGRRQWAVGRGSGPRPTGG